MRIESSVTSVSWIPSESMPGPLKAGFFVGATHYDEPPPEIIGNLDEMHTAERFRFANHLAAWIEVEDGHVLDAGYSGRGYITCTRLGWGSRREVTFQRAWNLAVDQRPAAVVFPESASNRLDCAITGRRSER
jgi:hypothetical protein